MAAFDFIEASSRAYKFTALHKDTILRLAAVPLLIKLVSFMGVTALNIEDNVLRQGLLLLPSYFAEGWLVAQLIRMAIYQETWPMALTGDAQKDEATVNTRGRPILAAAIIYVLIKLALSVFSGLIMMGGGLQPPAAQASPSAVTFLVGMITLGLMIWGFRLLWLYVPVAMGYKASDFLRRAKSYVTSIYMIGVWLLCFVPMALILVLIAGLLDMVLPGGSEAPSAFYTYTMVIVQAVIEMIISIVASIAMAMGIQTIYQGTNRSSFR